MPLRSLFSLLFAAVVLVVSGCADDMFSADEAAPQDGPAAQEAPGVPRSEAPYHTTFKKLRHPQLLERAMSASAAGKASSNGTVHLFLAFNEYGGDGMAKYSDGKLGTGKKDPATCGTFSSSTCSMAHLKGK